ncbi:uncharacterized protein LOC129228084 [Uloborus diversus]|uniref:uncharacterized protein LOC129228084 n=1 Tax=Uloborus diversus TaxID=327109 RepID=UPI002409B5A9|nr:uncharacterized protein LOC129228084 [Uloborus diversus]
MMSLTDDDFQRKSTYGSIQDERRTSCCFAGDHFLTSNSQEFVRRSLSMDSVVHVDISDINGEGDISYVPLSLRKCKKTVIAPYSFILSFIGWRPWCQDSLSRRSRFWKYFNCVYPIVVVLFIVCHYVFQVLGCQGKFNIHLDVQPSKPPPTPKEFNMEGNCTWGLVTFACHAKYVMAAVEVAAKAQKSKYCQHIIPTYIVPSFVHFLAYAYGLYHFRLVKCEQLYSLMERVFLQTHSTHGLQNALVRNSRLFFTTAILWLLCQVGLEVLYNFTFSQTRLEILGMTYKYVFLGIKFVGMILVHAVNVAVVINYCVQCETLILYIKGVCLRLHEKSMEIKSAMHEILGVREYISSLNGSVAKMMSLCIVNFTELTVLGTALLFFNKDPRKEVLSYRVIFPLLWFIALMVPLIQAARLTRIGSKLRQISFEMRVFGYQASSMLELDSFVLFVSGATLRSKLFGFTIRSSTVIMTFGLSVFVLVTLMVVDLITVSGYSEMF